MWINHDDYIEAVEKNSGPLNRIAGFQETISAQLNAIREGQDKLIQSQAGVEASQNRLLLSEAELEINVDKALQVGIERLAERLANIEVAFTVRLEALERKLETVKELVGYGHYEAHRPNGKHPAGKRK
jgi:phage shock protein A